MGGFLKPPALRVEIHVAVIWLQIAILLSSIAALLKKKPLWLIGLAAGIVGLVYFGNGFFTVSL